MSRIVHKIRTWRLPRLTLFAFALILLALSLMTAKIAWQTPGSGAEDITTLTAKITKFRTENFKSSKTLRLEPADNCGEFMSVLFDSFDFEQFSADFSPGSEFTLVVRKADSLRIKECLPVEFLALSSSNVEYLVLELRDESALSMRRFVAGVITGILIAVGLLLLLAGFISLPESDTKTEVWDRKSIFKR